MFTYINQPLTDLGLHNPNLSVLTMDAAWCSCLFFQPGENIRFGDDFIQMANRPRAIAKFTRFFTMATQKESALVLAPEYSCPTPALTHALTEQLLPAEQNIWIIGGESIKAAELQAMMAAYPDVSWITESNLITANLDNEHFFNPVYHIFKTKRKADDSLRTVVVVQFKTHHLGGIALRWERDHFIPGTTIYILQNKKAATRLVTLNCADIFNPLLDLPNNLEHYTAVPYLIIHLQLNTAPNNINYRRYRGDGYSNVNTNLEFICLNWAWKLSLGELVNWNQYGGSAIYMKVGESKEVDTNDPRMVNNDLKGLYYTRWKERRADVYYFNYAEHVFELRKEKTMQTDAIAAVSTRSGPEMIHCYAWDEQNSQWEVSEPVQPGFAGVCDGLAELGDFKGIKDLSAVSPVDAERLVYLTVGKALDKNWHQPPNLTFFEIDDTELPSRIVFAQNPDARKRAERKKNLYHYGSLEFSVITDPKSFPENIADLSANCRIAYRQGKFSKQFHLNLYPLEGSDTGAPATGVYIGQLTAEDAEHVFDRMADLLKTGEDGKRVVVWWRAVDGQLKNTWWGAKARITDNTNTSSRGIRKMKRNK